MSRRKQKALRKFLNYKNDYARRDKVQAPRIRRDCEDSDSEEGADAMLPLPREAGHGASISDSSPAGS